MGVKFLTEENLELDFLSLGVEVATKRGRDRPYRLEHGETLRRCCRLGNKYVEVEVGDEEDDEEEEEEEREQDDESDLGLGVGSALSEPSPQWRSE